MKKSIRVGADVGGTFTDVALQVIDAQGAVELATAKVLTNYSQSELAIVEAIEKAAEQAGVAWTLLIRLFTGRHWSPIH